MIATTIESYFSKNLIACKKRNLPKELEPIYDSLDTFFADKAWHLGGKIPPRLIFNHNNFRIVNNISLENAIKIAYRSLERASYLCMSKKPVVKNTDIKLCLKIIKDCEIKGIPYLYIGGMLILYLKLCEKVEIL